MVVGHIVCCSEVGSTVVEVVCRRVALVSSFGFILLQSVFGLVMFLLFLLLEYLP